MLSTEKLEWKEARDILDNHYGEVHRAQLISNGADYRRNWVMCKVLDNDILIIARYFKWWWKNYFKKNPNQGSADRIVAAFQQDFPCEYIQDGYDMYMLICKDLY